MKSAFLAIWLLLAAGGVLADLLPASLQKGLQQARLPESALSLAVVPISGLGAPIYFQADTPANPASVMKLITSYSALNLLGSVYQWPTELRAAVSPKDGILNGDLYVKGYGDPKLTIERVWLLLRDLRATGVREVRGDLVLDRSYFNLLPESGQFEDDGNNPERPYLVPPDALMSNFKSLRLMVRTGNGAVLAHLDPPLPEVMLDNRAQLGPVADCANWRAGLDLRVEDAGTQAKILMKGRIPPGCSGERYLAALDHATYTASLIRTLWREMGGIWQGGVRQATAPADAVVLAASRSAELPLLLRDINKYSNNGMARQVFLTLGAQLGQPADGADTASRSVAVIRRWVVGKGWNWPELVLENGAGLSRIERVSARHLADMLVDAARGPMAAEFIATLPIVAVDGTMKRRLLGDPLAGEAYIKTGSLKDVRSLAGYVRDKDGRLNAVVAILNHPRADNGMAVLDEVLRLAGNRVGLAVTAVAR